MTARALVVSLVGQDDLLRRGLLIYALYRLVRLLILLLARLHGLIYARLILSARRGLGSGVIFI